MQNQTTFNLYPSFNTGQSSQEATIRPDFTPSTALAKAQPSLNTKKRPPANSACAKLPRAFSRMATRPGRQVCPPLPSQQAECQFDCQAHSPNLLQQAACQSFRDQGLQGLIFKPAAHLPSHTTTQAHGALDSSKQQVIPSPAALPGPSRVGQAIDELRPARPIWPSETTSRDQVRG